MKTLIFNTCVIFLLIYCISFPFEIAFSVSEALRMCASAVIPSLFVFTILAKILSLSVKEMKLENKLILHISRLLSLPPSLVPLCVCGLFCGAPSCTAGICELYASGFCTKDEAERAIIVSNNCSAAFITGFAASCLADRGYSKIILFSNIISTLTVYFLFFRAESKDFKSAVPKRRHKNSLSEIISDSITYSANTVIKLCGYIVFFYCLSFVLSQKIANAVYLFSRNPTAAIFIKTAVCSFFEMTTGVLSSASLSPNLCTLMISGSVSFCGISVFFQVMSLASKHNLGCRRFLYSKILCSLISPLITLFLLFTIYGRGGIMTDFLKIISGGFTLKDLFVLVFITCVCFAGACLLSYLDKKHKNKPRK